jgi:hypothetical protein
VSHSREQIALSLPPAIAHSLNEAIQEKPSQSVYFWIPPTHPGIGCTCLAAFAGEVIAGQMFSRICLV